MKLKLCLILAVFGSCFMRAQDLEGFWKWTSPDGSQQFEIELEQINEKEYRGSHCAIFDNGERIDCNSDQDTFSIERDVFPTVKQLYTYKSQANLIDVGVPERLESARQKYRSSG